MTKSPLLLLFFLVISIHNASAHGSSCFGSGESRLVDRCLLSNLGNGMVSVEALTEIDTRFKQMGYVRGIGIDTNSPDLNLLSIQIEPNLRYSSNTNGGNPRKDLVLHGYNFAGTEDNWATAGLLVGINAKVNASAPISVFGEGRFVALTAHFMEEASGKGEKLSSNSFTLCSKNHLLDWWYLDSCYKLQSNSTILTDYTSSTKELMLEKVFNPSIWGYSSIKVSVAKDSTPIFDQNKIKLAGAVMFYKGTSISYTRTLGRSVEGFLSLKAGNVFSFQNHSLSLNLGHYEWEGGSLMGVPRDDIIKSISVSKEIGENVIIDVGFSETKSTINYFTSLSPYFSVRIPSLSLQLL